MKGKSFAVIYMISIGVVGNFVPAVYADHDWPVHKNRSHHRSTCHSTMAGSCPIDRFSECALCPEKMFFNTSEMIFQHPISGYPYIPYILL